ncbi:protein cornichon homolog 4-like [Dysidea avara]|uniref:protein cornichon homolog 4-like n=1 Tax=Dysidea avara TaxID=196820 RepID=UPI00332EC767
MDVLVFMVCLFDSLGSLFLGVYCLIQLSDLECDYVNTKKGCQVLNTWVLPEIIIAVIPPVILLLTFHWFLFLLTAPVACFLIHRYATLPPGSIGIYDPTEIRNRGAISKFQTENFIKIGYSIISFLVFLYWLIYSLIN